MSWFHNLKLASTQIAAFSAVLALTAILGVFAIAQLSALNKQSQLIATSWMPGANAVGRFTTALNEFRTRELQHLTADTPKKRNVLEDKAKATLADMMEARAVADDLGNSPEQRKLIDEVKRQLDLYLAIHAKLFELSRNGKSTEAEELLLGKSLDQFRQVRAAAQEELRFQVEGGRRANETSDTLYASGRMWVIGILLTCVALGMALAARIARIVVQSVKQPSADAPSASPGTTWTGESTSVSQREAERRGRPLSPITVRHEEPDADPNGMAGSAQKVNPQTSFHEALDAALEPFDEADERRLAVRKSRDSRGNRAKIEDALDTVIENLKEAQKRTAVHAERSGRAERADSPEKISGGLEDTASKLDHASRGKVLVADDSDITRKLVIRLLNVLGVTDVLEADDGDEALRLFARHDVEVVLTDWRMPGKSGLELLRDLREQDATVPVIMVTTESEKEHVLQALQAGVSDYLVKPFETDVLRQKLVKFLPALAEA